MPSTKEPKFEIGDVVKHRRKDLRGVIFEKIENGYSLFKLQWYHQNAPYRLVVPINSKLIGMVRQGDLVSIGTLRLCEGVQDSTLCDKCEYRFQCWTTRQKV